MTTAASLESVMWAAPQTKLGQQHTRRIRLHSGWRLEQTSGEARDMSRNRHSRVTVSTVSSTGRAVGCSPTLGGGVAVVVALADTLAPVR
jgi:hypothetical protein